MFFVSFCSTVLHCKITVKNKADYFADFTYRGLFLERIPRDKRGFTVYINKYLSNGLRSLSLNNTNSNKRYIVNPVFAGLWTRENREYLLQSVIDTAKADSILMMTLYQILETVLALLQKFAVTVLLVCTERYSRLVQVVLADHFCITFPLNTSSRATFSFSVITFFWRLGSLPEALHKAGHLRGILERENHKE